MMPAEELGAFPYICVECRPPRIARPGSRSQILSRILEQLILRGSRPPYSYFLWATFLRFRGVNGRCLNLKSLDEFPFDAT